MSSTQATVPNLSERIVAGLPFEWSDVLGDDHAFVCALAATKDDLVKECAAYGGLPFKHAKEVIERELGAWVNAMRKNKPQIRRASLRAEILKQLKVRPYELRRLNGLRPMRMGFLKLSSSQSAIPSLSERIVTGLPFDWSDVLKDDYAFACALAVAKGDLIKECAAYGGLPRELAEIVIDRDLNVWTSAMGKNQPLMRRDSLRAKIVARFNVARMNCSALRRVINVLDSPRRGFLDVGSGQGFTLFAARDQGFKFAHGIEIDPAFANFTATIMPDTLEGDVGSVLGDFLSYDFDRKYDLINFFDVFEHVFDAQLTLEKALSLLNPKGVLYIYQGNAWSPSIVSQEPHYRLPFLTLMDRNDVIRLLLDSKRIKSADNYVVTEWPTLEFFANPPEPWRCFIHSGQLDLKTNAPYMTELKAMALAVKLRNRHPLAKTWADRVHSLILSASHYESLWRVRMRCWNLVIAQEKPNCADFQPLTLDRLVA